MSNSNIFSQATRIKLRFSIPTQRAFISGSVEDLWDVKICNLKTMAECIYQQLRTSQDTLYDAPEVDPKKKLSLEILKEIISIKSSEAQAIIDSEKVAEEKRKLISQLAKLEDKEKDGMSKEEVLAKLAELEK